ncbi:MAG: hypothetical protein IAG13_37745 [Deltaproteobacteria bacterium]|nr:hypothetical protein [Nannocystaceae bacterium]
MGDDREQSLEYLRARVDTAVRGGFLDAEQIADEIAEWVADELDDEEATDELVQLATTKLAALREAEATWTQRTTNDAIDAAFAELEAAGIIALQNAGYTQTEGWEDVAQAADERVPKRGVPLRGAVFYHGQDLERGVAGQGLMIAFGAFEDGPRHEAESLAIARELCEMLTRHGVAHVWNGSIDQRVGVTPFAWQRRRFTTAPPLPR